MLSCHFSTSQKTNFNLGGALTKSGRIARIKRIFFLRTIGLFHPHGKSVSICEYLWETKIIIRVPKIFVTFELFVFKERIRVYLCLSVCQKCSIRVQRKFVFKKAVRPSPTHQCRTQADHLYLICHARRLPFPSPDTTISITSLHHFTTFLPFTIYIP